MSDFYTETCDCCGNVLRLEEGRFWDPNPLGEGTHLVCDVCWDHCQANACGNPVLPQTNGQSEPQPEFVEGYDYDVHN